MRKYYIRGKGEIRLCDGDFKAQGGQAAIYAQGSTAYKIYTDRLSRIPPAKIGELSVLARPNIVRPLDILLDDSGDLAGYSMRYVDRGYLLCQLFPPAFRDRHNFTPDHALRLVQELQTGVSYVHFKGILIVDLNEMNFLVSGDLKEVFFLDVDSYQTPSFPATAIMDSVRDRHATAFHESTDWFAFAIVSFQVFTGLHPYKGTYPPFVGSIDKSLILDERMKRNISVLHAGVSAPATCLPFDVIPSAYLAWYRATFEDGHRGPPPAGPVDSISVRVVPAPEPPGESAFTVSQVLEFDTDIVERYSDVILTRKSIYAGARRFDRPCSGAMVALAPRLAIPVALWMDHDRVRFLDIERGRGIDAEITADEIIVIEGRAYLKRECDLMEIEFVELSSRILVKPSLIGHVLKNSRQLFDGVVFQNLLGAWYASFLPEPFTCYQTRIKELDGYTIVDARCIRNVMIVVGSKSGCYDSFIFRFRREFDEYDVRSHRDIDHTGINFTVLDTGICLSLAGDELEIFKSKPGDDGLRVVPAGELGDIRLFHHGTQALFARKNKLFKFSLRQ